MNTSESLVVSVLDLTRLKRPDNEASIISFANQAKTSWGYTAGLCVYPEWIKAVSPFKGPQTKLITVANFPDGHRSTDDAISELQGTMADEIDVVMPFEQLKLGQHEFVLGQLQAFRLQFPNKILKAILEVAKLSHGEVRMASELVCQAEFNFIKTSTGTIPYQIKESDIEAILDVIQSHRRPVGLKLSGGIHTKEQALCYVDLVKKRMGSSFLIPEYFRIGASSLLASLSDD